MRALLSFLTLAALLLPAPVRAADLTVDIASNFLVDATINGHAVRLRVDPATSGYIILNPEAVARIGLRPSMLRSATRIGPVRLTGSSKVAEVAIGGVTRDRRLVWIDRPAVDGADGLIGPADMPYERVTFTLGAPRRGEATAVLPMEFARGAGLSFPLRLGEDVVRVQFSLIKPESMATAGAGALIAAAHGGGWMGEVRDQPIDFGVSRPVRAMWLERAVDLGYFQFRQFLVRTGDHRGNLELPPDPDADPDEVVVTGGSRQRAIFALRLGLDRLSQCSRLVWDNGTRHLTLDCTNLLPARPPTP